MPTIASLAVQGQPTPAREVAFAAPVKEVGVAKDGSIFAQLDVEKPKVRQQTYGDFRPCVPSGLGVVRPGASKPESTPVGPLRAFEMSQDGSRMLVAAKDHMWGFSVLTSDSFAVESSGSSDVPWVAPQLASQDGKAVAYLHGGTGRNPMGIWTERAGMARPETSTFELAAFSADGKTVARANKDSTFVSISGGKTIATGHGGVGGLSMSPDATRVLVGAWSEPVQPWHGSYKPNGIAKRATALYDAASGAKVASFDTLEWPKTGFSADSQRFFVIDGSSVSVYDRDGKKVLAAEGRASDFSPDGKQLVVASGKVVRTYDLP